MKKTHVWLVAVLLSLVAGGSQANNAVLNDGDTRVEVLGAAYAQGHVNVASRQSRLVVYSLQNTLLPGATSLFVNGSYHASLIQGAYSELCYRPGNVEVGARQMQVGQRAKDQPDTITALELKPGQSQYLRVSAQSGRPVLQPVTAAQALQELPATRLQQHTISRVSQPCELVAAPAPVAEPLRHTLDADSLFAFGRSDRNGMMDQGIQAIDQFLNRLGTDFSRIDRLHIVGHADPLGSEAVNQRLSLERAHTVRQYIERSGRLQAPITVEGRGSRELVTANCPRVSSAASRACNAPNRRVVIEITGLQR